MKGESLYKIATLMPQDDAGQPGLPGGDWKMVVSRDGQAWAMRADGLGYCVDLTKRWGDSRTSA